MIDLKEAGKNPAYTLSAMLYGLQNPISTKDMSYKVNMKTFGSVYYSESEPHWRSPPPHHVCYGCAATSTLEVITGRSFAEQLTPEFRNSDLHARAVLFDTKDKESSAFETAIDYAREGNFGHLMKFFGHLMKFFGHNGYGKYDQNDITMHNHNWREKVPAFEGVIQQMHEDYPKWEQFKTTGRTE